MSSDNKNAQRVAKCRARRNRVELLLKPEEYAAFKRAADGKPIATYIKSTVLEQIAREGR